jgi:hypothetical protein
MFPVYAPKSAAILLFAQTKTYSNLCDYRTNEAVRTSRLNPVMVGRGIRDFFILECPATAFALL